MARVMRRFLRLGAAIALVLLSSPSFAQPSTDPATRSTARKLANEGLALSKQGDYAAALEKFNLADSLVPAPTLGLEAARCLEKLGRLVEASERYLEVTRVVLPKSAPAVHRQAQLEALEARERILPRLPMLEILLHGPRGKGIQVLVDGKEIPLAALGTARPIDPGKRTIVVKREDTTVTKEVEINEKARVALEIDLPPLPPEPDVLSPPPGAGATQRMWGWVALGVGGGGLVMSAISGAVALSLDGSLVEQCGEDRLCPADKATLVQGDISAHDISRALTTTGLIIGVAGAGAGLTLLFTAPSRGARGERSTPKASFHPFVGPTTVGVRGVF